MSGYREPKLAINRVYTRKGDSGTTALVGGQRVDKCDPRIDAYGTVDELNSIVGAARQSLIDSGVAEVAPLAAVLLRVQHELFNLGSVLATLPEDLRPEQPRIDDADVRALEEDIDRHNSDLPALRSFVLPGGHRANTDLHLARTVCRRAERLAVALARTDPSEPSTQAAIAYLNRLSDALFVWSRWASRALGADEVVWDPNLGASGSSRAP
jgi:cob(I)alamin adenosyltransferase